MNAPLVFDVTEATFERDVIARSHEVPVVVDFWAAWCGPCRMLGPVLEGLAREANGAWVLAKVDTDHASALAARFQIQGIPAVKAFVDGRVVDDFVGARPAGQVQAWLDGFVPNAASEAAAEGDRALAAGDPAAARVAYQAAIGLDPKVPAALLGLASLAVQDGDPAGARGHLARLPARLDAALEARRADLMLRIEAGGADPDALVERLGAHPEDLDTRWALAHGLAARQRWEEALGHLLEIVRRDRTYRDDGARKAMLLVFERVGTRSPLADAWRSKLATVLYG